MGKSAFVVCSTANEVESYGIYRSAPGSSSGLGGRSPESLADQARPGSGLARGATRPAPGEGVSQLKEIHNLAAVVGVAANLELIAANETVQVDEKDAPALLAAISLAVAQSSAMWSGHAKAPVGPGPEGTAS